MTLASDVDLRQLLADGRQLTIDPPLTPEQLDALVQPSSIDLRLHHEFRIFRTHQHHVIDPAIGQEGLTELISVPPRTPLVLQPGQFVLGSTYEWVRLERGIAGQVHGKSSRGRLGIQVHATAGVIDPGFGGRITLEISNLAPLPVLLWPGMTIAQLQITALGTPSARPYGIKGRGSHYQAQSGPTESLGHQNFRIWGVYEQPPGTGATESAVTPTGVAAIPGVDR